MSHSVRPLWQRMGLQARVLVLGLGAAGAVWLSAALFTGLEAQHELDELLDAHLAQSAALLLSQHGAEAGRKPSAEPAAAEARAANEFGAGSAMEAPALHRYAAQVVFQVWHGDRLLLRSAQAPDTPLWDGPKSDRPGFRTTTVQGQRWRLFRAAAPSGAQVVVGERLAARRHLLAELMKGILLPIGTALPFLGLGLWWAVRRGSSGLRSVSAQLYSRHPDSLQPVVLEDPPAELSPLLDALNRLLTRTARMIDSERRFTADAAHELRTPLAALRAQAQVALGATDDAQRQHALEAVLQGCDRAARLVEQLLTLARLEAADRAPNPAADPALEVSAPTGGRASVDLAKVVREVAAELGAGALARHQQLELEAVQPGPVRADPVLLAILVRNLVDNALRYSPERGRVCLHVQTESGVSSLVVEDSGSGMAAAAIARLGERFFRVLGHEASGSGLGWSIVRRIASAQGARVVVDTSPRLGGLRVAVHWPST